MVGVFGVDGALILLSKLFVLTREGKERDGEREPFGDIGLNFRSRKEFKREGKHVCTFW